ncbi:hypothetical protein HW132_34770 [Brasilonema sp. CT11]|nr:hypothetical protein [Brasilonema sp. CT11]
MYGLIYSLGFHWHESRFALALLSLDDSKTYKICDLIEIGYCNELEIEQHIQSMVDCEKIKEIPVLKLIDKIVAEEIFQRNKYGYSVVECNLESEIQRLNLKLQNGSVVIDHYIASFVFDKLQCCTDYKTPGASVAALAIALHNFHPLHLPQTTGQKTGNWLNFKF